MLDGVASIASAGVPGPLAVIGERAQVLVAGEQDGNLLPVAVAAEWEAGRVVAVGHGGMIGASALAHEGTRRFVTRAAGWAGRRTGEAAEGRRVAVVHDNKRMGELLAREGWEVVSVAQGRVLREALAGASLLVVDVHAVGDAEREVVREFVRDGGGLITAGLGGGWLQLNPGKTIHDHPGNRLLAEAGIVWCDGYLETTVEGGFAVQGLDEAVSAHAALSVLERELWDKPAGKLAFGEQAGAAVMVAARATPAGHAFAERCERLLASDALADRVRPVISEEKPLRARDGVSRVLVALDVDREKASAPQAVRAHPSHVAFPGVVAADAERIRTTVVVRGGKRWESTGLYVPAGEVVTLRATGAARAGVRVLVGAHSDELWHHGAWKRVPDVQREFVWGEGEELLVASAFGGLLYLERAAGAPSELAVEVRGVVRAPHFELGKTSAEEWQRGRTSPAPWAELASEKVIVTVPSTFVRELENPEELMRFWDAISDAHAELATIAKQPAWPHRFVADVQISAGYMHAGYPIMTHLDAAAFMTNVQTLRAGSWGLLHELGHNHQEDAWTFDGTVEVTCNLFTLHAIDTICTPAPGDRGHEAVNTPPNVEKHLAMGAPFEQWKQDPFLALHMYVQLERAFGWETYKRVFAEYRTLKREELPRSDAEKRDQWMVRFSRACGRNLGPFFEKWGVPTGEAARASVAGLPGWMPPEWEEKRGE